MFPEEVVFVQTANIVAALFETAAVATSDSARDPPRTSGEDNHDVPALVLSWTTASHGLELFVPVRSYHMMNVYEPDTATWVGHELSLPAKPIAVGVDHVTPALVETETYS